MVGTLDIRLNFQREAETIFDDLGSWYIGCSKGVQQQKNAFCARKHFCTVVDAIAWNVFTIQFS